MKTLKILLLLLSVLVSVPACATTEARHNPAQGYSYIHKDFDLRYAWNLKQTDRGVSLDGLIKNVRYARIEAVEINVSLLDKANNLEAKGVFFPVPYSIERDDYTNFGMLLKGAKLSEGDHLQFLVTYTASAGQNAFSWVSTFTVDAATGATVGSGERKEDSW